MSFPSPVPFEEHEESPVSERGSRDGSFEFVRRFTCAWSDRIAFMAYLLNGANGGPLSYPGAFNLFVRDVDVERIQNKPTAATQYAFTDASSELIQHGGVALLTVSYAPIVPDVPVGPGTGDNDVQLPDGTYLRFSKRSSAEFLSIPSRALIFETTGSKLPADQHPVVRVPLTEFVVEWMRVSLPPWDAIESIKGTVNDDWFRVPGSRIFCAPETLLFDVEEDDHDLATSDLVALATGTYVPFYRMKYVFKFRAVKVMQTSTTNTRVAPAGVDGLPKQPAGLSGPDLVVAGWNHGFDASNQRWDRIVSEDGSGRTNFPLSDFRRLFLLGAAYPP